MMDKQATVNTCYHMNSLNDRWMMRLKAVYLGGIASLKSMALHRTRRVATERLKRSRSKQNTRLIKDFKYGPSLSIFVQKGDE